MTPLWFQTLMTMVILIPLMVLFWMPTVEAYKRRHRKRNMIFLINFFLGFSVIGWIIAFIWSQSTDIEVSNPAP